MNFINCTNIVLAGGGCKTIIFLGIMQKLKEMNIYNNITSFSGSSMGGILAFLFCIYDNFDIKILFNELKLDNIKELYTILGLEEFYYNFSYKTILKCLNTIFIKNKGIIENENSMIFICFLR